MRQSFDDRRNLHRLLLQGHQDGILGERDDSQNEQQRYEDWNDNQLRQFLRPPDNGAVGVEDGQEENSEKVKHSTKLGCEFARYNQETGSRPPPQGCQRTHRWAEGNYL